MRKISKGEYPEEIIDSRYGAFILKFPSGLDFQVISRKTAACCGGMPLQSFPPEVNAANEINSTLDVVIKDYPKDFPGKWKHNGIVDFPDWEVKNALFKAFNSFYTGTQNELYKESGAKPTTEE